MYDFSKYDFSTFTDEDREACLLTIDLVIECSVTARKEGVLALEDFVFRQYNDFLTFGISLVVDGTDPEYVANTLNTLIQASGHTGKDLLERLIIAQGVLEIQAGVNPRMVEMTLFCLLGEKYMKKKGHFPVLSNRDFYDEEAIEQRIAAIICNEEFPESRFFNKTIQSMGNRDIQQVFREVDQRTLAIALRGCDEVATKKIFGNFSNRLKIMILDDIESMGPVYARDAVDEQKKIYDVIKRLMEYGEIIPLEYCEKTGEIINENPFLTRILDAPKPI